MLMVEKTNPGAESPIIFGNNMFIPRGWSYSLIIQQILVTQKDFSGALFWDAGETSYEDLSELLNYLDDFKGHFYPVIELSVWKEVSDWRWYALNFKYEMTGNNRICLSARTENIDEAKVAQSWSGLPIVMDGFDNDFTDEQITLATRWYNVLMLICRKGLYKGELKGINYLLEK